MSTAKRAYDILRGFVAQEYERLSSIDRVSAEKELDEAPKQPPAQTETFVPRGNHKEQALKILGVSETASVEQIVLSYERLNERSDPSRFPTGAPEQNQAREIQRRVRWAYRVLAPELDSTELRFRTLEIE